MILRTITQRAWSQGFRALSSDAIPAGLIRLRFTFTNVDWSDSTILVTVFQVSHDAGLTWSGPSVGCMQGNWRNPSGLREPQWFDVPFAQVSNTNTTVRAWLILVDPVNPTTQYTSGVTIEGF